MSLVLVFRQLREVNGISEGEQFRFTCTDGGLRVGNWKNGHFQS